MDRQKAVDVHHERLSVEQAKTDARRCLVDLTLDVIEELNAWCAECGDVELGGFMFATASGKPRDWNNIRTVLSRVFAKANEQRAVRGLAPLPPVVPNTLRRTYISLMLEASAPLQYMMNQVGHRDGPCDHQPLRCRVPRHRPPDDTEAALRRFRRIYFTRENLRAAIVEIVNTTLQARDELLWGPGTLCTSDSKQFGSWDSNPMTEWHAR
jgi:integrase